MTVSRLYIPPHTRLETVWRVVRDDGTVTWQCWTATPDRNAPFHAMLGTAIVLHPTGAAQRMTLGPDDSVTLMDVM